MENTIVTWTFTIIFLIKQYVPGSVTFFVTRCGGRCFYRYFYPHIFICNGKSNGKFNGKSIDGGDASQKMSRCPKCCINKRNVLLNSKTVTVNVTFYFRFPSYS